MKALRPALPAGGLIVVWLAREIGPSALVAELHRLSWQLTLILLRQVTTTWRAFTTTESL